jgi:NitT/TauT family transport system substrate-binding protein
MRALSRLPPRSIVAVTLPFVTPHGRRAPHGGRRRLLAGFLVAAAWAAQGCTAARPLRLGVHPWIGNEPLLMADELGWLDKSTQLVQERSAPDLMAALVSGHLDGASLTLDEMLTLRGQGVDAVAVLVLDESAGADMVVARAGIDSLPALKGRRLAVERSAVGELMLVKTLEHAGLTAGQIEVVPMRVDDQLDAWREGRIDAAITYEPMATALQREAARRLFDSRALPETIFDVLAMRRRSAEAHASALVGAIRAHLRGLEHLRVNRADAVYRIAAHQRIATQDVIAALAGVALPDLARNKALLGGEVAIRRPARALADLMLASGLLTRRDPLDDAFDADYLPARDEDA